MGIEDFIEFCRPSFDATVHAYGGFRCPPGGVSEALPAASLLRRLCAEVRPYCGSAPGRSHLWMLVCMCIQDFVDSVCSSFDASVHVYDGFRCSPGGVSEAVPGRPTIRHKPSKLPSICLVL